MNENKKQILEYIKNIDKIILDNPSSPSDKYLFHLFPFGERGTQLPFELINLIKEELKSNILNFCDSPSQIITLEPGGNQWALLMANELRLDLYIARYNKKFNISASAEIKNKYSIKNMYFPTMPNKKTILIDDVISSGKTVEATIKYYKSININISAVFVISIKSLEYKKLLDIYNIPIYFILLEDGMFPIAQR